MIVTAKKKRKRDEILDRLCDEIVAELMLQGFDAHESEVVFEALAEKYGVLVRLLRCCMIYRIPKHSRMRRCDGDDFSERSGCFVSFSD